MSTWEGAFGHVRRRTVEDVRQSINVATPFSFDIKSHDSDLPDYVDAQWETIGSSDNSVINLPGREINLVRDTLMAANKFYHVIDCARTQVARGAMTWAMVDAYHASLVGTKAMFALYGLFAYSVRGRTVLVDFRPEFGSPDDANTFRKANKGISDPIRILMPKPKHLEQKDSWALAKRLCNITPCPPEDAVLIDRIRVAASAPLSGFRNLMLYDSVAWEWMSDFSSPRIPTATRHSRITADDESQSESLRGLAAIFEFVTGHITELGLKISFDPTKLSYVFSKKGTPADILM